MKLYKSITVATVAVLGMVVSGCSDWLDYEPKDKQTFDQQFSTPTGFYNTVNGIYNSLAGSSLYGYNLSYGPIDVIGMCYKIEETNYLMTELVNANYTGTYSPNILTSIWASAYNAILNINVILQALDEKPGVLSSDDEKIIRGEMLATRAFLHFDLVRLFGPVYSVHPEGLTVPYADAPEVIKRSRLTIKDILDNHIIPDLNQAQELLSDIDPVLTEGVLNTDGGQDGNWNRYRQLRMNFYAATLVKARAYLWISDYENALIEARKITDDPNVDTSFPWVDPARLLANTHNPDRAFSTECLFGFYNNKISDIFENHFNGNLDAGIVMKPRDGYTNTLFPDAADYRRQSQWVSTSSATSGGLDFIKYKSFQVNSINPEFWASFFGIMRKSEAYYIVAECLMQQNDMTGACKYLNDVKNARGLQKVETTDKTKFLKELKLEYLCEMRGEGQIFFMLKRFCQSLSLFMGDMAFCNAHNTPLGDTQDQLLLRYEVPIPSGENY